MTDLPAPLVPAEVDLRGVARILSTVFRTARVAPEEAVFRPALPLLSLPGLYGADMSKMTYGEQLRHPNWQRRRLEIMESAGFACQNCGDNETTLNVHHRLYVKGRLVWDYADHELECLCEPCHRVAHENRELLDRLLSCGVGRVETAIGLLTGYLTVSMAIDSDEEEDGKRVGGESFLTGAMGAMLTYKAPGRQAGDAIREVRAGTILNPSEEQLLRLIESLDQAAGDDGA